MTVAELIAELSKEDPNLEVMRKYHLHDYCRTVEAVRIDGSNEEEVFVDASPDTRERTLISDDNEQSDRFLGYGYKPKRVIIID